MSVCRDVERLEPRLLSIESETTLGLDYPITTNRRRISLVKELASGMVASVVHRCHHLGFVQPVINRGSCRRVIT